jgi:hypothetical protein
MKLFVGINITDWVISTSVVTVSVTDSTTVETVATVRSREIEETVLRGGVVNLTNGGGGN